MAHQQNAYPPRKRKKRRQPSLLSPHPFEKASIPVAAEAAAAPSRKRWFRALLNPLQLVDSQISSKTILVIPLLAFALFFLQIGLDQVRVGQADWERPFMLLISGGLFGLLLVPLAGGIGWLGTRPFGGKQSLAWTIRAFSLAYLPALVYSGMGLLANLLFGWHTAVSFGVTGVLWSMGPMLTTLRRMTDNRLGVSITLTTVCGLLLLVGWAVMGGLL